MTSPEEHSSPSPSDSPPPSSAPAPRTGIGRIFGAIDDYWMTPAPAERLATLRIAVGTFALLYLLARLPYWLSYAHFNPAQYRPVGILAWLLPQPLVPIAVQLMIVATTLAAVGFVLGWRYRIIGPLFSLLLLWMLSYRNSWGMVFHTENLMVLQVLVLGITRAADRWSLDATRIARMNATGAANNAAVSITAEPEPSTTSAHSRYGWPIRLMCWLVVIAYVLAGIAKLRNAGFDWLWGDELRNHIALDNARKILLGDFYSPLAGPLMHWDVMYRVLAFVTIVAEIGAPLALIGRRIAAVWVVTVMGFHFGVVVLMMIMFPYQMFGCAFLCFFRPETWPSSRWWPRWRPRWWPQR